MVDLCNKKVLIFGASSGMGQAVAQACLQAKMRLAIGARRLEPLENLLKDTGDQHYCCSTDVTNINQVQSFVSEAVQRFQRIDYVINCAGLMYYQTMINRGYDQWLKMVDTNIKGFLNITDQVLQPLVDSTGMYINITSDAGRQAFPGLAVYSGTKAFMESTIKAMRLELAQKGVRFVNLQPGNVATPLQKISTDQQALIDYGSSNAEFFLQPEDIASAVLFTMRQPPHVSINELLIEPQCEPI